MHRWLKVYRLWTMRHEPLKMLSAIAFTLSVLAAYSSWDYFDAKEKILAQLDKRLYSAAASVPFLLANDFHDRTKTKNSISKAEDNQNIENLSKLNNRLGTKFLYTVIQDENGTFRLSSSSALDEEIKEGTQVPYFEDYSDVSPLLKQSFEDNTTLFSKRNGRYQPIYIPVMKDRWGTYRTIFLPMRTEKGNIYAVGADMDISYINSALRKNIFQTILEFLLFSLAVLPIMMAYVTMLKRKQEEFQKVHKLYVDQSIRSVTDPLTQLYNRYKLDQDLQLQYDKYLQYGESFGLLMIDLDHFKNINDHYGHQTGDEVLAYVAKLLKNSSRESDTVGRWGGEEFMIIYPNSDLKTTYKLADKLRSLVAKSEMGSKYNLTISLGIGIPRSDMSLPELVHSVDSALYKAKQQGRNQTVTAEKN